MKIELNTGVCKLFQPDTYGSEICYNVRDDCMEDVKAIAMSIGEEYLNEAFKSTDLFDMADCAVTKFVSPTYYNFETDSLDFEFEFYDYIVQFIADKYYGDEKFFEYIKKEFGSCPGFSSFMPVEPKKFFAALTMKLNDKYDFERAISMVLHYEIMMSLGKDMLDWEREFIEDWREEIGKNGYELDEEDELEMEMAN